MLTLAEDDMGLPKETRHDGGLYVFQDKDQFDSYAATLLANNADEVELLDGASLIAREPGLQSTADSLVGGFYSEVDSVGDCHLFSRRVCDWLAQNGGAEFRFGVKVNGLLNRSGRIEAVRTDQGDFPCSSVILATGVETPHLTVPLGFAPNIYPVKGYSGTWRVTDPSRVPVLPFVDETALMAVATYGGILRVTAIAEFARHDKSLRPNAIAQLDSYVRRSFTGVVDLDSPEFWAGLRPTTPAGSPYLGRVRRYENLWINAGHGQLGWTMSIGAGALLADAISGKQGAVKEVSSTAAWLKGL